MTELIDKEYVTVALVTYPLRTDMIGIYETRDLAERRVMELMDLGTIGDDGIVTYSTEIVWGEKNEDI